MLLHPLHAGEGFLSELWLHINDLDIRQAIFVATNPAIMFGYGFIATRVAPLLPVRLPTLTGAFAFFMLCAMTHLDQVIHTLGDQSESWGEISREEHMLLIHIPQAVAVWIFATGFFLDLRALRRERHTSDPAG